MDDLYTCAFTRIKQRRHNDNYIILIYCLILSLRNRGLTPREAGPSLFWIFVKSDSEIETGWQLSWIATYTRWRREKMIRSLEMSKVCLRLMFDNVKTESDHSFARATIKLAVADIIPAISTDCITETWSTPWVPWLHIMQLNHVKRDWDITYHWNNSNNFLCKL